MKSELSSLDLHFLLKEFDYLIGAKIEQIYQIGREELILQLHVPSKGKQIIRIILGKMIYLASSKGEMPEKPHGFCLHLRKKLKNSRLRSIHQLGFERVIEYIFETKEGKFRFIIELFSKGNIILCNEEGKILSVLERQEWKGRSLKPGQQYVGPKKDYDFLELTKDQLDSMLNSSDRESLVKSLAIELSLGGTYAEEVCILAGVNKNLKPNQLSDKEVDSIFSAAQSIKDKEISPAILYKTDDKTDVKDIVPFPLEFYKALQSVPQETFNTALDSVLTVKSEAKAIESAAVFADKKLGKVAEMIRQQEQRIEGLERSEKDNQRKGEVIYENYPLIEQAIIAVKELKNTMSWKEISEHFKGHKIIKSVDTTTGELTLEL